MDSSVSREINNCISELYRIANELENAAGEVEASILGLNTKRYTDSLYECAKKYRRAARNLEKIK